MSAIGKVFVRCHAERRAAFIPFLMGGDPDLETTGDLLQALVDGGADILEIGVPFSDPIADGPVNQRAAARALASGTTLSGILNLVARKRERLGVPIVLFSYYNPIHVRGVATFAEQAAASGVDGVLSVDLPPEEGGELVETLGRYGLDSIFLLSPTSPKSRVAQVNRCSSGFVYYVSRTGVTGERDELPKPLLRELRKLRRRVRCPLVVGFGVSRPEQVAELGRVAHGVVVGSALVRLVEERAGDPELPRALEERVRWLASGLGRR